MAKFDLFIGVTAVQTIANVRAVDGSRAGNNAAQPHGAGNDRNSPAQSVAIQVLVTGTSGATVSATVQPVASIDGINWATIGGPIATGSATNSATAIGNLSNQPFKYFSAYVTAVSGTGATVSATLSG